MPAIPPITAYPVPTRDDLPENTARWELDPDRAALLIHDMQNFFLRPFPEDGSPRRELLANTARLRDACAGSGMPVAYTEQPGDMTEAERGLLRDFWGPGMRRAEHDRAVTGALAPRDGDWRLTKWRYSAFQRTDLLDSLRAAGRDQLVVCGVYAHVGILMTCVEAFSHDIQPFLVADAVADFTADYHRLAVTYAAERCAVVQTTDETLARLARTGRAAGLPAAETLA
ncbi:isochorismatase family protein [Actinacidiphila bryophytorum]|uniref:Phenazine biosynthesis protein PhzD1 n=1 Tax=Actinacidiphila bryophytorum TaxID=1436133 RepID=A0A9W4MIW4_9ACTN|nr:isochorismatase family protein [Actinacidiphila bryophytorum]MBM9439834.1 isochorismatase family protein [Actinacidiphila bryophytorum]MBN6544725.1 isochorismatase family protein [Actinacidiphila bryophytorum]CAG7648122.1 Phenazine biosynthesis protein PhzD1 [Actinacidiphila bryophytorum]